MLKDFVKAVLLHTVQITSARNLSLTRYIYRKETNYTELKFFLEKPPIGQPLKNFSMFYGTKNFIAEFTGPYHEPDQSGLYYSILQYIRSIGILSSHIY
jgi:hypothetical protein